MTNLSDEFREALRLRFVDNPAGLGIQFRDIRLTNVELQAVLQNLREEFGRLNGARVVLLLPDSLEAYILYLQLFLEKAVLVPVPVQSVGTRILEICERVQADVVITTEFLLQAHKGFLDRWPCLLLRSSAVVGGVVHFEFVNYGKPGKILNFLPVREDESVRFIIFTSGSTGTPKGVCLSEDNILAAADMMAQFLPMDPATFSMVTVPLFDYYGMIQVFGHILGGGAYVFGYNTSLPSVLLTSVRNLGVTDLVLVPHTLRALLSVPDALCRPAFGALRRLTSSSDMLTEDLLRRLFELNHEATMVNIYGLTEAGRACYRKIKRETPISKSIGVPSKGVEIEIRGQVGEIVIRGPNVMLGYLTGVDIGGIRFGACSEMVTGDIGYIDVNGEIMLLGRRDHMINLMGMKIHPCEIETAALRLGVADAHVRVVNDLHADKVIHLDVVCEDSAITAEYIIEELRENLPRVFVPRAVNFVTAIERTEIGAKIRR